MRILLFVLQLIAATGKKRVLPLRATSSPPKDGPDAEYTRRLTEREGQLERCRALHLRFWIYLIASVTAATGIGLLALSKRVDAGWILPPLAIAAFSFHALTRNARLHSRLSKIVVFYESGIERLTNRWQGRGTGGNGFQSEDHLYAADLDVFGVGSLFEFLCTARTGIGCGMLANWLLYPADPAEILRRQHAVAELRDRLDLREEWTSLGEVSVERVEASHLSDWVSASPADPVPALQVLAITLPVALLLAGALAGLGLITAHGPLIIGLPLAMEALVAAALRRKTREVIDNLVLPSFELGTIAPLLGCLEKQQFECPLLRALQARLLNGQVRSSQQLARLRGLALLLDLRRSEYFAVALSLVLWGTNLAFAVEWWRERNRARLPQWLEALGQFEALFCLARYAYENPTYTFPVLRPDTPPLFKADSLGHPLLPRTCCVPCNVALSSECQFLMVSGSNMSGKSTLLRSVGLNAVLASAGAPVRAAHLEISPLRIGSSITVHDSLMRGKSRFAAEVGRLKEILAVARERRVLFLLDEMLGGTNSKDRFFGAKAVLDDLVRTNAIGLVTTHDLSLTELVIELGAASNVHFEEQYQDGEMHFDYTMRPGVLARTNGLHIIAALGLGSPEVLRFRKPRDPGHPRS